MINQIVLAIQEFLEENLRPQHTIKRIQGINNSIYIINSLNNYININPKSLMLQMHKYLEKDLSIPCTPEYLAVEGFQINIKEPYYNIGVALSLSTMDTCQTYELFCTKNCILWYQKQLSGIIGIYLQPTNSYGVFYAEGVEKLLFNSNLFDIEPIYDEKGVPLAKDIIAMPYKVLVARIYYLGLDKYLISYYKLYSIKELESINIC